MKLQRLEFVGIGSFADRMEIDFTALGSAGMFLVEGPTGSGKSTILDAIVFALYGGVAGSGSDLGRLDSHLRDRQQEPYVELDFACGPDSYRIRRTPRHERDKRRGEGTMRDEGSVSLIQLTPAQAAISHKAKEVGDWVNEHVGLTKQQFVSTIVLAQGEFATFLDADTGSRAQILEKVFGTQFYKHVEDQLASMRRAAIERRTDAVRAVDEVRNRCLGVLGLEADADIPEAAGQVHADLRQAQEELTRADIAQAQAQEQHAAAQALVSQQQRKQSLLIRQRDLAAEQDLVEQAREALSAHDRAVPAVAAIAVWRRAESELEIAAEQAATTDAALRSAGGSSASAASLAELATLLGQLQGPAQIECQLDDLRASARAAQERAADAAQQVADMTAAHASVSSALAPLREQSIDEAAPLAELAELQMRKAELDKEQAGWQKLAKTQIAVQKASAATAEAAERLQSAKGALQQAQNEADRDHAADLATRLRPGDPCLVCGATEHPAPARFTGTAGIDVAAARRDLDAAHDHWMAAKSHFDGLAAVMDDLREGLGPDAAAVEQEMQAVTTSIERTQATIATISAVADQRERLVAQMTDLQAQLAEDRVVAERAAAEHATALKALTTATEVVARAATGFANVADRVAHTTRLHSTMAAALDGAARLKTAQEASDRADELLQATLTAAGLTDVDAAEAALLAADEAQALRSRVEDHDRARDEVRGALAELQQVDLAATPDLAALTAALANCTTRANEARERQARVRHTVNELQPLLDLLTQRLEQRAQVLDETAGVIRMAELAAATRGEVMHRVRLSSFVLMRRFEAVVEAANDRLDAISEGRYQLQVETDGLDNRAQAGLDLIIADQRTDRCRSTRSLSGGERFYVSLALALGLADVVRSESGGVQLGTLFIDEGFGSLDVDVLEEVMDMLEQVRAGEDRVIGLVSHVDLLKQRIDPRISVRRDPQRPGVSTLAVTV